MSKISRARSSSATTNRPTTITNNTIPPTRSRTAAASIARSSAAFPIPSATYGDIPAAAVELNGTMEVDAPALSAYARGRLGVRAPRRIVVLAALPRNANGKVLKRELAAALAQGRTGG